MRLNDLEWGKWKLMLDKPEMVKDLELLSERSYTGYHWSRLLCFQPRFSVKCPWEILDGSCWSHLLQEQPKFAGKCRGRILYKTDLR